MEKVLNGQISFSQISNEKDNSKVKFNFEIVYSKSFYVGSYTFDYENEKEKELLEFFNNDLKKTFKKLAVLQQNSFKNKIYKYIESTKPAVWVAIADELSKSQEVNEPVKVIAPACNEETYNNKTNEPSATQCDNTAFKVKPDDMERQSEGLCLNSIFKKINLEYFNDEVKAKIQWSKNVPLKKRTSILLGSFDEASSTIKISPCLKKDFVPRYFIESVVYHEMLHCVHDIKRVHGRNQIHNSAFKEDEKKFEHFEDSQKWLKNNLTKLLSA